MIPPEELFIERLNILAQGVHQHDKLDVLPVAAALRQLLLDDNPLIHQVNRQTKLRIQFRVNRQPSNSPHVPTPIIEFPGHGLDPSTIQFKSGVEEVNLENFLKIPVIKTKWGDITIHELVDYLCHKEGAVHRDPKRTQEDEGLETVFGILENVGIPPIKIATEAIAKIVLNALIPLRNAIWSPPNTLPLFAFYRQPPGERLWVSGDGRYLNTEMDSTVREGFTFASCVLIPPIATNKERFIYDLGTPKSNSPRLSLFLNSSGEFVFRVRPNDAQEAKIILPPVFLNNLFSKGLLIIAEAKFDSHALTLTLYHGNQKVAEKQLNTSLETIPVKLQTLGASLEGQNGCRAAFSDIVLVERVLTVEERSKLARYLHVQTRSG